MEGFAYSVSPIEMCPLEKFKIMNKMNEKGNFTAKATPEPPLSLAAVRRFVFLFFVIFHCHALYIMLATSDSSTSSPRPMCKKDFVTGFEHSFFPRVVRR